MRNILRKKKGAIELSISTIVIIVLAMSMLILGIVLVRNIMCGAIGIVATTDSKVKGEVDKLFQSSQGEVVCLGQEGGSPITIVPGQINTLYCAIQAPAQAEYQIKVKSFGGSMTESQVQKWVVGEELWKGQVPPGDSTAKKYLRLNVPDSAPQGLLTVDLEIYKDGTLFLTPTVDFQIKRLGFFQSSVC